MITIILFLTTAAMVWGWARSVHFEHKAGQLEERCSADSRKARIQIVCVDASNCVEAKQDLLPGDSIRVTFTNRPGFFTVVRGYDKYPAPVQVRVKADTPVAEDNLKYKAESWPDHDTDFEY